MGFEQILPVIIGLLGGSLAGGSGERHITADEAEMQSLMKQMLRSQYGEYNYNSPLRQHITQTADWLLPKQSRMRSETPEYNVPSAITMGDTSNNRITKPSDVPFPDPPSTDPGPLPPPKFQQPRGASDPGMQNLMSYLATNGVQR